MTVHDYLQFGNTLTFEVYPSTIIGSRFEDVKVMGTFDIDTARYHGIDPVAMHNNVYPFLPETTENDPSRYQYVKLKHPNGSISVIGVPWINQDTIQISQRGTLKLTIEDVGVVERERVVQALSAIGLVPSKVELL